MKKSSKPVNTAVVLAGGPGSRLCPLTNSCPKPMIRLLDKPILQWIIEWLKKGGIKHVVLGVAYRKESIMEYFGDGEKFDVNIDYSTHSIEGETGEGFRLAIDRYVDSEVFMAMNGDEITNTNLHAFIKFHRKHKPIASILVSPLKCTFGMVKVDNNHKIVAFNEKPKIYSVLVSTGIYMFDRQIVDYLPLRGRVEESTFPILAEKGLLLAYPLNGQWLTINTKKDLETAELELKKRLGDVICPRC